jgi:hypothetical protein
MIKVDRLILTTLFIAVILFFTGVFQMFVYDGKAKGCSGEYFQRYRDKMATEQIAVIISEECTSYRTAYKVWKYIALASVVVFLGSGLYAVAKQKETRTS